MKYKNIFWSQGVTDIDFDDDMQRNKLDQIENDVTKSFLNLLELGSDKILEILLKMIDEDLSKNKSDQVDYKFQVNKHGSYERKLNYIISLRSKRFDTEITSFDIERSYERPDGLLLSDDFSILFEVKTKSPLDKKQIKDYNTKFYNSKASVTTLFWEDIYSELEKVELKGLNSKERFLLTQFLQYLELINLAGFQGIPFGYNENEDLVQDYDTEFAKNILQNFHLNIAKDLEQEEIFLGSRKMAGKAWGWMISKEQKQDLGGVPSSMPNDIHYTTYLFKDYFGFDITVGKAKTSKMKKLAKNEQVFKEFCQILQSLKDTSHFYIELDENRLLNHVKGKIHGAKYKRKNIHFQVDHLIKDYKNWKSILKQMFMLGNKFKLVMFKKKYFYEDKESDLQDKKKVKKMFLKDIKKVKPLYNFLYKSIQTL